MKSAFSLCFFLVLTVLVRCHNFADVFVGGQIYFVDGDCYSRMSRVRMVMEHPLTLIRHQNFENYPQGVESHATAPFDYLIAILAVLLKPFTSNYLDFAGAIVSPLMAVMIIVFLWAWSEKLKLPYRGMLLLMFAVSPMIVHGTVLGRPDHQSLQMLCIAVALGAEWCLSQMPSRGWGIISGAAWGLGLWTSLYEPLILFVLVVVLYLVFDRRKLWSPERRAGWGIFAGITVMSLAVQGLPFGEGKLAPEVFQYFAKWESTISEMSSSSLFSPLLYQWVGFCLVAAPVLFLWRYRERKQGIPLLLLLLAVWGLALWQARWGYFFALVYAMTLPFQFGVFRKPWVGWCVLVVGAWPLLGAWDSTLYPKDDERAQIMEQRADAFLLRDAAEHLKSGGLQPVLAPWWFSPALAYWSGQPEVGGSSHESLPGIVDSARFYLADKPEDALKVLQTHGVKWVVAYYPPRIEETSAELLDQKAPELSMARILYERPHSAPEFLKLDYANPVNPAFKIFKVEDTAVDSRQ